MLKLEIFKSPNDAVLSLEVRSTVAMVKQEYFRSEMT